MSARIVIRRRRQITATAGKMPTAETADQSSLNICYVRMYSAKTTSRVHKKYLRKFNQISSFCKCAYNRLMETRLTTRCNMCQLLTQNTASSGSNKDRGRGGRQRGIVWWKETSWWVIPSFGQVAVIFPPAHGGNWVATGLTPELHTLVHQHHLAAGATHEAGTLWKHTRFKIRAQKSRSTGILFWLSVSH